MQFQPSTMTIDAIHEIKMLRDCPFLKSREAMKEVIEALPFDARIIGFFDCGGPEINIRFTSPSVGPSSKYFVVTRGPAMLRAVPENHVPKI